MSATVKLDDETHKALRELAARAKLPMNKLVAVLLREHVKSEFFDACDKAYRKLREDPVAWAQEIEERRILDGTLMDGLEDEDWSEVYPQVFKKTHKGAKKAAKT